MNVRRRTLFKLAGLATAGAVLPGCRQEIDHLVPYLLPDDEIVPGVADWYASVCGECQAGCGILVRVMEGRAKKIEGNPNHPVNRGKLCARGQAGLQRLYNPDRIQGPLTRDGTRGEARFTPLSWEQALQIWVERARAHRGRALMLSGSVSGTLGKMLTEYMKVLGGRLVVHDPQADLALTYAVRRIFGRRALPRFDLAESDYVLSFGTPLLEHWISPVAMGRAYGHMRQGRPGVRGRLIQVEPRMSLTAANADRWIPIRPGTEGLLAIGIGQWLLRSRPGALAAPHGNAMRAFYHSVAMDDIIRQTEISHDDLVRLVREFDRARAPMAIAGGPASAHTNGTAALTAVMGLNVLMGTVGKPGGLQFFDSDVASVSSQSEPAISDQGVLDLIDEAKAGRFPLVHLHHCNPLHTIPPSVPVRELFDRAEFVVSFNSFMDESTAMADLILPDHTPLERWGDHWELCQEAMPAVGLAQPVVMPLYDTRATGDLVLQAARQLEARTPGVLSHDTMREAIRSNWRALLSTEDPSDGTDRFDRAWVERLQEGGWWGPRRAPQTSLPEPVLTGAEYDPAGFEGPAEEFPFYFYPYPSLGLGHGEGANLPWLQELPDPLTTAVWGTWAEINPTTAESKGIRQGDLIRVISTRGSLEIPAVYVPGIRPDLIAVPIGQGHHAYGRYAAGRGADPLTLLAPRFDEESGRLATAATRVRIETTHRRGRLVLIDQREMRSTQELIGIERLRR